jgi:hypothetical protein
VEAQLVRVCWAPAALKGLGQKQALLTLLAAVTAGGDAECGEVSLRFGGQWQVVGRCPPLRVELKPPLLRFSGTDALLLADVLY